MLNLNAHKTLISLVLAALIGVGCSAEPNIEVLAKPCQGHGDCPGDQVCIDQLCAAPSAVTCQSDVDCPQGYKCLSDGSCDASAECETNIDCCPPEVVACDRQCQNLLCVGTACSGSEAKQCYHGCHAGESICEKGDWTPCSAPRVQPEVCDDGIDNDCNGKTDDPLLCPQCTPGASEICQGPCGEGTRQCDAAGIWSDCDATTDCTCDQGQTTTKACGYCGQMQGTCSPEGVWSWSNLCTGEGVCAAATVEAQDCGNCGAQERICSEECTWGEYSECTGMGECAPGADEEQSCGACGAKLRICDDMCTWSEWSICEDGAGCDPSIPEMQEKECGNCGVQTAVCEAGCSWSPFGACLNQGECAVGQVDTMACGNCGQQTRTCGANCAWGQWGACTGSGACQPGDVEEQACGVSDVGICQYGIQSRGCNLACQWNPFGSCAGAVYPESLDVCGNGLDEDCNGFDDVLPDNYESNNTCGTCTWLGTDPDVELNPSFDNSGDKVDYFCFEGVDSGFNPFEAVQIELSGQSVGLDADIFLYDSVEDCQAGHEEAVAKSVTIGGANESIDWGEGFLTGNSATFVVEVRNYGDAGCYKYYTLMVKGLK